MDFEYQMMDEETQEQMQSDDGKAKQEREEQ